MFSFRTLSVLALLAISQSGVASDTCLAQGNPHSKNVIYQYPATNSREVSPTTAISLRSYAQFDAQALSSDVLSVVGSRSGTIPATAVLSRDKRSILIHPRSAFAYGETVSVMFTGKLAGGSFVESQFSFQTMKHAPARMSQAERLSYLTDGISSAEVPSQKATAALGEDAVLPSFNVQVDDHPAEGKLFLSNFSFGGPSVFTPALFVLDQDGKQIAMQNRPANVSDFKAQPNGIWTFFDNSVGYFFGIDSNFNIVSTYAADHGYITDGHDLLLLPNGGYILLGISKTTEDMSESVTNGMANATAVGNVIQEFDSDHNVIFEWRGIDNFHVVDAVHENLTANTIDFEHANSLALDTDGNIILSNRHLSEITKINRQTGEIMWRLGGVHNQFRFLNDSVGFSYQHDARILPNGHLTLFDNGNYDAGQHTRVLELQLDTAKRTAEVVWEYHHVPETYSVAMGNAQRLSNGNTLIGWGANALTATEVRPDKSVAFELTMGSGSGLTSVSYRVRKEEGHFDNTTNSVEQEAAVSAPDLKIVALDRPGSVGYRSSGLPAGQVQIRVSDALGRECRTESRSVSEAGTLDGEIDLHGEPAGVYFLTIVGQGTSLTRAVALAH